MTTQITMPVYEITIRDSRDVETIAAILEQNNITKINLTDKNGLPSNLEMAKLLRKILPELQITLHYAFKNHTRKIPELIQSNLKEFLEESKKINIHEVLLISGSPKPKLNGLTGLEYIRDSTFELGTVKIGTAYNPYLLPGVLEPEKEKLVAKIATQQVSHIYLQIGSNVKQLEQELDWLKTSFPNTSIIGSLLIPTEKFLNQFKFRPWYGVDLDENYMRSLFSARKVTSKIAELYEQHGVETLIQLVPFNNENVEQYLHPNVEEIPENTESTKSDEITEIKD